LDYASAQITVAQGRGDARHGDVSVMTQMPACPYCGAMHPAVLAGGVCPVCGTALAPESTSAVRPTTILWIDDDRLLLSICGDAFERFGFQVLVASDGATGIELAKAERPDLILLDVVMFGMDGFEVCQRLRAEPALLETPIVLLTVLDDAGIRERGRELGATSVWSKPFGPDDLIMKVTKLLGQTPRRTAL
jgi:CheY-like chemotaxis protein